MSGPPHAKEALRARLLARRRDLSPEAVAHASRSACERLVALPAWREARWVGVYAAVRGELDLSSLWQLKGAQRLAFPVVTGPEEPLSFFAVEAPDDLIPGRYGIPGPDPRRAPEVPLASLDLVVVPGVAFDPAGHRLGLGKGYYDRTLPHLRPDALQVGAAHDWQLVEGVPTDPWDVPMDLVVTPTGLLRTRPKPPPP